MDTLIGTAVPNVLGTVAFDLPRFGVDFPGVARARGWEMMVRLP
jgi:hypothetical protein